MLKKMTKREEKKLCILSFDSLETKANESKKKKL